MAKVQPAPIAFPQLRRVQSGPVTGPDDAIRALADSSIPRNSTSAMRQAIRHRSVQIAFAVSAVIGLLVSASALASSVDQFRGDDTRSGTTRNLQIFVIAAEAISAAFFITTLIITVWAWTTT